MAPNLASPARRGFTLVEMSIALGITGVVMGSVVVALNLEASGIKQMTTRKNQERTVEAMLGRVGEELEFARGVCPEAFLTKDLYAGEQREVCVDGTSGFPPAGRLILHDDFGEREHIAYLSTDVDTSRFLDLQRGLYEGAKSFYAKGRLVRWAGMAVPIENQQNPSPDQYDGKARERTGLVYFRGDGVGFTFRVPVDPDGDGLYFQGSEVTWGARLQSGETTDGWCAVTFQPVAKLREEVRKADLNRDGDLGDSFDVGRIRMVSWNAADPTEKVRDPVLCPPNILQLEHDWGGDFDGDGFEDPMFLWDDHSGRLHVRLFVAPGLVDGLNNVERVDATFFLRNGVAE